jgi:hypothetical protein
MIHSRIYARVLRPALSLGLLEHTPRTPLERTFHAAFSQVDTLIDHAQLAAA